MDENKNIYNDTDQPFTEKGVFDKNAGEILQELKDIRQMLRDGPRQSLIGSLGTAAAFMATVALMSVPFMSSPGLGGVLSANADSVKAGGDATAESAGTGGAATFAAAGAGGAAALAAAATYIFMNFGRDGSKKMVTTLADRRLYPNVFKKLGVQLKQNAFSKKEKVMIDQLLEDTMNKLGVSSKTNMTSVDGAQESEMPDWKIAKLSLKMKNHGLFFGILGAPLIAISIILDIQTLYETTYKMPRHRYFHKLDETIASLEPKNPGKLYAYRKR